jgi:hypothetical protein
MRIFRLAAAPVQPGGYELAFRHLRSSTDDRVAVASFGANSHAAADAFDF